ncbi:MAG TPA: glycosyltransferase N-terminal domain-containing protein, partial [bacterium]|nr:glycosyltransferase N-terminal domain-containing protein [bacterium]
MTVLREESAAEIAGYSAYAALVSLAAIPGALVAAAGAAFLPRWRYGLLERAGVVKPEVVAATRKTPRIWLHAASIGEVRAAHPLLAALRAARPDVGVLLTTMTPEGNRTAASLGLADAVSMLPLDSWGGPARLLDALQPDALVLLETELWPGLLRAARRRLIPVLVVNGRISARSFGRYAAAKTLLAPVLDDVAVFAMQAEVDRQRILSLGADPRRVELHGNLKYDAVSLPQPPPPDALASLRDEVVWVAGSTHDGEEGPVADAFLEIRRTLPDVRLIVAPRHKQRADEAARTLEARGLTVVRRSSLAGRPAKGAVILLDTSGELAAVYGLASAVFVGGSLIPRGGHNPLEPLAFGVPVAFGPHTANFDDVARAV